MIPHLAKGEWLPLGPLFPAVPEPLNAGPAEIISFDRRGSPTLSDCPPRRRLPGPARQ